VVNPADAVRGIVALTDGAFDGSADFLGEFFRGLRLFTSC